MGSWLNFTKESRVELNHWGIYDDVITWWRHQMETFSALLAICAGNSPVPGEFPAQRPVTRSFDVFFDLRLNKRLINNREAGDLRRHRGHYDVIVMNQDYSLKMMVARVVLWCEISAFQRHGQMGNDSPVTQSTHLLRFVTKKST